MRKMFISGEHTEAAASAEKRERERQKEQNEIDMDRKEEEGNGLARVAEGVEYVRKARTTCKFVFASSLCVRAIMFI